MISVRYILFIVKRRKKLRKAASRPHSKKIIDERHRLFPIEIKDLRNFVRATCKELISIEAEEQKQSTTIKPPSTKYNKPYAKRLYRSVIEPSSLKKTQEDTGKDMFSVSFRTIAKMSIDKQLERQRNYEEETRQINEQLNGIQRKIDAASIKLEMSRATAKHNKDKQVETATKRKIEIEKNKKERLQAQYIKKARIIENFKLIKTKATEQVNKNKMAEIEKRRLSQAEYYRTRREREKKEIMIMNEKNRRSQKPRKNSLPVHRQRDISDGFEETSRKKKQMDNNQRLGYINEYKRNKVIEKHIFLTTKNEQRRVKIDNVQNNAIAKRLMQMKDMDLVYDCLSKMKKANPYNPRQRTLLLEAINRLNEHFNLKLDLSQK